MRRFLVLIAIVLTVQACAATSGLAESRYKSFCDAEQECAEYLFITNETLDRYHRLGYPDEPSVRKLINCILVDLNAWDEDQQQVKNYVLNQFFVPNSVDCQYEQRTLECLAQNVTTLDYSDRLGRAYQSFQCYNQYYAGASCELQWVPFHFSETDQIIYDCLRIVNVNNQSLLENCQGRLLNDSESNQVAYCFYERAGYYDINTGIDLKKLYIQLGANGFNRGATSECISRTTSQYCTEPGRFTRIWRDCLVKYLPGGRGLFRAASRALGNPADCVIPPRPPPNTQPCYNAPCQ